MFADAEYYKTVYAGTMDGLTDADFEKASRHISVLTYGRANRADLTEYQKKVLRESTCMLAEFEHENADILESLVNSYSLNGASVSLGGGGSAAAHNGIYIRDDIYSYLRLSGLCCGVLR